ncbi:hypothetical protein CPLU01_15620 [Colletotrichum plurivorum]|uniref:Uncharacterized protein n=1 Tax=Colletotrichum plurivorum TaxID=2175906 RepID=A0A8H6J999_9PEZI|nr:hypothetical protein CPLU01_15620 [Colletotrichum plurivorum]
MEQYKRQITQKEDPDTNDSFIDDYKSLDASLEADENAVDGHCVVLHMCIKLLRNPAELPGWFFSVSPYDQKVIRLTILEQMNTADTWLTSGHMQEGTVDHRRAVLCNTTMALIQAEKATEKSSPAPSGPSNDSTKPERAHTGEEDDYISQRHLDTLQYIQAARESYGVDEKTGKAIRTLENFSRSSHSTTDKRELQPNEISALQRSLLDSIKLLESRALEIHSKIPHLVGGTIFKDCDYENLHRLWKDLARLQAFARMAPSQ